jgi:RNA polymerase sigma-70 factor, ECF subfamily
VLGSFPALQSQCQERARRDRGATLVDSMHNLDPQSLSQHVDRLYRAAWALCGSREDAEDLVQETFARVLSRPRVLHGDDDVYYLMRVLRNTFLTSRRTASRRPVTVAELEDVITPDPRPMGRPEQAFEVQELYGTIAELPENFRLALVAVDVLGLSYREAARALRVREATLTTRLFRARKQVAARLSSEPEQEQAPGTRTAPSPAAGHTEPTLVAPRERPPQVGSYRREDTGSDGVLSSGSNP